MGSFIVRRRQRISMRRSVRVDCEVVRERDFRLIGRRGIDLSAGGMLVLSEGGPRDARLLTGEDVLVTFRSPLTRLWCDCTATVARIIHGRRPGDWGPCVGLTFESMDEVTQAFLRAELKGLPPPIPSREARIDYAETVRQAAFG